ncbi:hypothetical protein L596_005795 [Steinernema carpocapsae]|uniref:Uncharacterized protein n=1 Tax=Steinernema carpocapsae TaxID=34508 RepID=A0A4U8V1Q8_STECR|nr:hypothetical protein L596_005795 [Steinernema carpocapsae]
MAGLPRYYRRRMAESAKSACTQLETTGWTWTCLELKLILMPRCHSVALERSHRDVPAIFHLFDNIR